MSDWYSNSVNSPDGGENEKINTGEATSPETGEGTPSQPPFAGQYPYGNQPPYGGQPPYGNQPPYGGYPYGAPYRKKPSLMKRITEFFTDKRVLPLSLASIAAAASIILFQLLGDALAFVVTSDADLWRLYLGNYTFTMAFGMLHSAVSIGGPFLAAYIFLRRTTGLGLPLSAPKRKSGAGFLIPAGLGVCYVGNVAVSYLMSFMSSIGISSYSYDVALSQGNPLPENAFQLICNIMYIAVFPAVFEEFAFRGVIMQPLRKYGDGFAIIVSSVLFGLVHGNFIQMPFAIIAGIAIGYATTVTGSMWTGIIIHFLNNFLSLIYSWVCDGLSGSASIVFSALFTYGTIVIGFVALAGYAVGHPDMLRLYPSRVRAAKRGQFVKVYFLMPAMLVALVLMVRNILLDMVAGV